MSAQASVFYGDLANTFSLWKAARAHKLIEPQLLALNLIIHRRSNGTLSSSPQVLSHVPVEIWTLIRDQIYPQGLESVLELWTREHADAFTDNWGPVDDCQRLLDSLMQREDFEVPGDGDSLEERQSVEQEVLRGWTEQQKHRCMTAAQDVRTSIDWDGWMARPEFHAYIDLSYSREKLQEVERNPYSSEQLVWESTSSEIEDFLSVFGLEPVCNTFNVNDGFGGVADLFTPISIRLPQNVVSGVHLKPPEYEDSSNRVLSLDFLNQEKRDRPFHTLHEKYQVEFAGFDVEGEIERDSGIRQSPCDKTIHPPNPCWKLHCRLEDAG